MAHRRKGGIDMNRYRIITGGQGDIRKSAHYIDCYELEQTGAFTVKINGNASVIFMDFIENIETTMDDKAYKELLENDAK